MPTPDKNETKKHYISRCIPTVINEGTTKDPKQAAAICFSMWKKHHKGAKAAAYEAFTKTFGSQLKNLG